MRESELITIISRRSDRYGSKLVEFMEKYRLRGLCDATAAQLEEFIKNQLKLDNQKEGEEYGKIR